MTKKERWGKTTASKLEKFQLWWSEIIWNWFLEENDKSWNIPTMSFHNIKEYLWMFSAGDCIKKIKHKHWLYTRQADAEQHNNTRAKHRLQKEANMSVWGKRSSGGASDGHTDTAGSAWLSWTDRVCDWNSDDCEDINLLFSFSVKDSKHVCVQLKCADFLIVLVILLTLVQDVEFSLLQVCRSFSEAWPLVLRAFCSNLTLSSLSKLLRSLSACKIPNHF